MRYGIIAACVVGLTMVGVVGSARESNRENKEKPDWTHVNTKPDWIRVKPDWIIPKVEAEIRKRPSLSPSSIRCMAENIYHEARGDSYLGQVAVGLVVINRVRSSHFPDTPCSVIWERAQFSWTLDRRLWNIKNVRAYNKAREIAIEVLEGKHHDFTDGSTHYYQPDLVNPRWAKSGKDKKKIGAHLFMKMKSGGR